MPLRFIKNIASKLLGRSTTVQLSERPAAKADGRADRSGRRKPAPPSRETSAGASGRRGARPERAAPPPREGARREPPRREPRGERGPRPAAGDTRRPPRSAVPARAVHSDPGVARPGGVVDEAEIVRRREAHAAWSPDQYQVAPVEGKRRFHDFDLPGEILHAVADLKFEYCTPIQALSLEHALAGKNVAGKAQTGTGKTAAFLVALLTRYLRTPEARPDVPGTPRALVIAPTRELVIQICKDADALGKYCALRYLAVYGGMDYDRQRKELQAGPVDLLVATPGRLLDFVSGKVIDLSHVDSLVIDEADRMLDMGFIPDVKRIIFRLPPKEKRCTMLYSATLNDDVMRLAAQWMTEPVRVDIDSGTVTVDTVQQVVYIVTAREKFKVLFNLLKTHADQRVLVFCNRRSSTERVCENLNRLGVPCEMLSGDVQQSRRLRVLEDFRAGKVRVVVATDVAGRGLHVDDIGFVVNFDFPYEADDYVHRIGRTGRAGHTGTAISFADEDESFIIPDIEKFIGEPLKCTIPDDSLLLPIPDGRGPARPARPRSGATHAPAVAESPRKPAAAPEPSQPAPASSPAPAPLAEPPSRKPAAKPEKAPPAPVAAPVPVRRPVGEEWTPGASR